MRHQAISGIRTVSYTHLDVYKRQFFALPTPPDRKQILTLMEPWAPYAGMMYFHMLLDGLAERGDIHP